MLKMLTLADREEIARGLAKKLDRSFAGLLRRARRLSRCHPSIRVEVRYYLTDSSAWICNIAFVSRY